MSEINYVLYPNLNLDVMFDRGENTKQIDLGDALIGYMASPMTTREQKTELLEKLCSVLKYCSTIIEVTDVPETPVGIPSVDDIDYDDLIKELHKMTYVENPTPSDTEDTLIAK